MEPGQLMTPRLSQLLSQVPADVTAPPGDVQVLEVGRLTDQVPLLGFLGEEALQALFPLLVNRAPLIALNCEAANLVPVQALTDVSSDCASDLPLRLCRRACVGDSQEPGILRKRMPSDHLSPLCGAIDDFTDSHGS